MKKGPVKGPFIRFGSGGRIALAATPLSYVGRQSRPRSEPASQNPTLPRVQKKWAPPGAHLLFWWRGFPSQRYQALVTALDIAT